MKKVKLVIFFFILIFNSLSSISAIANYSYQDHQSLINGLEKPYKAKEIIEIDKWINSEPLKIKELKGRVVLVDFWTYSCINCLRTLPHIIKLYDNYKKMGLTVVGVHSPEFDFEKNYDNVKNAVERFKIQYPVAIDNQMKTWYNFNNQYWPAHYLIDKKGNVVYVHFGEGSYDILENNIKYLLGVKNNSEITEYLPSTSTVFNQTPETYLGYERSYNFVSLQDKIDETFKYSYPDYIPINSWALSGEWRIEDQKIISKSKNSKIKINFISKKVYLVMGSANNKPIKVYIKLNKKLISKKPIIVDSHKLFELIDQDFAKNSTLEIIVSEPDLEAFAFTFGK